MSSIEDIRGLGTFENGTFILEEMNFASSKEVVDTAFTAKESLNSEVIIRPFRDGQSDIRILHGDTPEYCVERLNYFKFGTQADF